MPQIPPCGPWSLSPTPQRAYVQKRRGTCGDGVETCRPGHLYSVRAPVDRRATSGAGLKDLMARMGHDSERAAMVYQHAARGADAAITHAIDAHIDAQQSADEDGDDGSAGALVPAG
jgi:hypothetical protein